MMIHYFVFSVLLFSVVGCADSGYRNREKATTYQETTPGPVIVEPQPVLTAPIVVEQPRPVSIVPAPVVVESVPVIIREPAYRIRHGSRWRHR